jgi:hypothetical protein
MPSASAEIGQKVSSRVTARTTQIFISISIETFLRQPCHLRVGGVKRL